MGTIKITAEDLGQDLVGLNAFLQEIDSEMTIEDDGDCFKVLVTWPPPSKPIDDHAILALLRSDFYEGVRRAMSPLEYVKAVARVGGGVQIFFEKGRRIKSVVEFDLSGPAQ